MLLYLVRHGKAEAGADDRARRLTDKGRSAVERVARRLQKADVHPERVEHSGLVRARQTAEILRSALGGELAEVDDLLPDADVALAADRLGARDAGAVMLVGHLPYMAKLTSYLVVGDVDVPLLDFATGSVACLEGEGMSWEIRWFVTPEVA